MSMDPVEATSTQPETKLPRLDLGGIHQVYIGGKLRSVDYAQSVNISLGPKLEKEGAVTAFGLDPVGSSAIISVAGGQRCNCFSFQGLAPHLHGTHIETRSHILREPRPVVEHFPGAILVARLITIEPSSARGLGLSLVPDEDDKIITSQAVETALSRDEYTSPVLILRTPNFPGKQTFKYGNTNPVYPHHQVASLAVSRGVEHIVLDLPSADREVGELFFHRTFWQDPIDSNGARITGLEHLNNNPRNAATITELSFIPDGAKDGWYLIHLFPEPFPKDAAPIMPIITPILDID